MSAVLMFALLLQVSTIVLLRQRLGRLWLRRPVTILVLTSVVYQGVSPVLLAFPSVRQWDPYRDGLQQRFADSATLLVSAAMLAFTASYLLTRPERASAALGGTDVRAAVKTLDWRLLALACLPLAVLTYRGRGYNQLTKLGPQSPLESDFAVTFFVIMLVLAAFSFVLKRGPNWFLPVLIVQSLLLAAAGERTPIIIGAVTLIVLLCHSGLRPPGVQVKVALALTVLTVLALTGVRAQQSRTLYRTDSGLGARLTALVGGLGAVGDTGAEDGLIPQTAQRLDGVALTGDVVEAVSYGRPRLSAAYVPESLLLLVPSAVWPSKLNRGLALNPYQEEIVGMGVQGNLLAGLPGLYAGFLSPAWLITFLAALGALAGWAERWLLRRCTPARLVMLAGALTAALRYEQGLPGLLLALRSAVVIALAVWAIGAVRAGVLTRRSPRSRLTGSMWWTGGQT